MPLLELQTGGGGDGSDASTGRIDRVLGASPAGRLARRSNCGGSREVLPRTLKTKHFRIAYDPARIQGGLDVRDYSRALETSWATEVKEFGWAKPPLKRASNARYPVRVADLGGGLYGFVTSGGTGAGLVGDNLATAWNDQDALATCMVLNQDYSLFPSSPKHSLQATAAHEFNHSIQFGYGALTGAKRPDPVFIEGGATWMEDEVFDGANDSLFYLWPVFEQSMGEYNNPWPYNHWVVFRALTESFGTGVAGGGEDVMQDFWELTSRRTSGNLVAMNTALQNQGGTLADAFHAAAIALKFNKACEGGYVAPYCLEEGPAYVSLAGPTDSHATISTVGDQVSRSIAENYATNWVLLPTGTTPYVVTLTNNGTGGQIRGSLVCDTGAALVVTALPSTVGPSQSSFTPFNPTGCDIPVAVLTNQFQADENPFSSTLQAYTLDT
jgi:hypothetical protein